MVSSLGVVLFGSRGVKIGLFLVNNYHFFRINVGNTVAVSGQNEDDLRPKRGPFE
jgi:hypothetical protein